MWPPHTKKQADLLWNSGQTCNLHDQNSNQGTKRFLSRWSAKSTTLIVISGFHHQIDLHCRYLIANLINYKLIWFSFATFLILSIDLDTDRFRAISQIFIAFWKPRKRDRKKDKIRRRNRNNLATRGYGWRHENIVVRFASVSGISDQFQTDCFYQFI